MKLPLINNEDQKHANQKLAHFYKDDLIPAEKKAYLTALEKSVGPYMGIETADGQTHYMMDAASQIATLGLGFNPSVFMGAAHFLESWLNTPQTELFTELHRAFHSFLKRKLGWQQIHSIYCSSGAEGNEMALGFCYQQRKNLGAKKVLAFEGSFHGRMLVSLASTWSKEKREPFQQPGYESIFCVYPDLGSAHLNVNVPARWTSIWDQAPASDFSTPVEWQKDNLLAQEVASLMQVRKEILSGQVFAIIIEPMQCEGGDRYASSRFHAGLLTLARSFEIPVVYDEVQTGFHLGRDFFWHRQFDLVDDQGAELLPAYVVCAKKAQVGLVLSPKGMPEVPASSEEFQVASAIRGYLHALALDQSQDKIFQLQKEVEQQLDKLVKDLGHLVERPRALGLAFAFDIKDKAKLNDLINRRFAYGLLYYPAGDRTLRFRLNTSFSKTDIEFLFQQVSNVLQEVLEGKQMELPTHVETHSRYIDELYSWQFMIINNKVQSLLGRGAKFDEVFNEIKKYIKDHVALDLVLITKNNFNEYRESIQKLQTKIYEPSRQTPIDKFERSIQDSDSICLGLINNREKDLVGIAFGADIGNFPLERGVRNDPFYHTKGQALYVLDTTVDTNYQGSGLGKTIKYALTVLAQARGWKRVQGRNRDRMAGGMLSINLSLGAFEHRYYQEDYPDFEEYRDVLYYTCPLKWESPPLCLSQALESHLKTTDLDEKYLDDQLPYMANKICLSNFVSERFTTQIRDLFELLPGPMRHGYTSSGQTECVDKVIKALWSTVPDIKAKHKLRHVTFKGHYFGAGSFAARSLSSEWSELGYGYFPVSFLDHPTEQNHKAVLAQLEQELKRGDVFAVWLEPLPQRLLQRVSEQHLKDMKRLCEQYQTPIVYNESAASKWRYHKDHFFASNVPELAPSLGYCFLGGQAGLVFMHAQYFLAKPLMMISTWDGDEVSFAHFHRAFADKSRSPNHRQKVEQLIQKFEQKLVQELKRYPGVTWHLHQASGWIQGPIPHSLRKLFKLVQGRYLVYPNEEAMERFLSWS